MCSGIGVLQSTTEVITVYRCSTGLQGYRNTIGVEGTGVIQECWSTVVVQGYRSISRVQRYRNTRVVQE
jgi:hypothetical protein